MKIAIVGGTGKEGRGMAARWARTGHEVWIGSRDAERARTSAAELSALAGHAIAGGDNTWAVQQAELVVLAVPYSAHRETLLGLKAVLSGKILVDITVPLRPPDVRRVALPEGKSAALEAQALLGTDTKVVAALHHVSAVHLSDLEHLIDCDVLACSDDRAALETVLSLIQDLGTRAFDAGPLVNAIALESLTPVLLHLNRRYKSPGAGIRFTGV
jgi:8-hydroxy-5-deazaflavin:NADPH oxidoreductase